MEVFKDEIERTLSQLRGIYPAKTSTAKFNEAFAKLLQLAQLGLVGETPATAIARSALLSLKAEIVDREAGQIKNAYMIKLGSWAALFGSLSFAGYFVFDAHPEWPPNELYAYRHVLLLWAGCVAGTWASFASRKVVLQFADLSALEADRVEPPLRLIFATLLTTFLALVFTTHLADVVVGGFRASDLLNSGSTALLVGGFAGLAEMALPAAMMQRAQAFLRASDSSPKD